MLKIDGSIGFGQVFRTSIALSSLTLTPVKIFNIRVRRPKPGLRPQHLRSLQVAAEFVAADIKGAKIGSKEVTFVPKRYNIPEYKKIDIGTAGSVVLLLQSILPLLAFSDHIVKLEIIGGTDVRGASTTIWFSHVFGYYMKKMGINFYGITLRHGFYPKGGGKFFLRIFNPNSYLKNLILVERGKVDGMNLWSVASKHLQKAKVAERQIKGFIKNWKEDIPRNSYFRYDNSLSPGSSLNAHVFFENCVIGMDRLGEKGKRAEEVGEECASELKKVLNSGACLDGFMADQILPFIALAKGTSEVKVENFTEHVTSNIYVIEKFLDVKFEIDKENKILRVKGIGFSGL